MSESNKNTSLFFIFLKNEANDLFCFIPLISTLPISDLLPFIRQKLHFLPETPIFLIHPQIGLLNEALTLMELNVTPYCELILSTEPNLNENLRISKSLENNLENNGKMPEESKDLSVLSKILMISA